MKFKKYKAFDRDGEADNSDKETAMTVAEQDAGRLRKKRMAAVQTVSLVLALALGATALKQAADQAQESRDSSSKSVKEEVISKTLERGSIETVLNSFGSIANAQESSLEVPGSIKVAKYYVKAGDSVKASDPIAELDRGSVMTAIAECEANVAALDSRMAKVIEDALAEELSASLSGRVVKIYAEKGEKVADVMYDHGALMLVSLDGLLSIEIPNSGGLSVGDSLLVKKSGSDKCYSGTIAGVKKDSLTVTVSMDEFDFEEEVEVYVGETAATEETAMEETAMEETAAEETAAEETTVEDTASDNSVADQSEALLAKGTLSIYSEQKITGYSGTVNTISVSEGDSVKSGKVLMTLSDTDYTAEYFSLLSKRDELVKQYNTLIDLSESGILYADHDGIVTEIDESLLVEEAGKKLVTVDEEGGTGNLSAAADKEDEAGELLASADWEDEAGRQTVAVTSMPTVTCTPVTIYATAAKNISEAKLLLAEGSQNSANSDKKETAGSKAEGDNGTVNIKTDAIAQDNKQQENTDQENEQQEPSNQKTAEQNTTEQETTAQDTEGEETTDQETTDQDTTEKTVKLEWKDENGNLISETDSNLIPQKWEIALLADGSEYETVSFTAEEEWTYTWEELPAYNGTLPISYTINCDVPEGFTASFRLSGNSMIITFARAQVLPDKGDNSGTKENETEVQTQGESESKPEGDGHQQTMPGSTDGSQVDGNGQAIGQGNGTGSGTEGGAGGGNGTEGGAGGGNNAGNGASHSSSRPSGSFGAFFGTSSNGSNGGNSGITGTSGTGVSGDGNSSGAGMNSSVKDSYSLATTNLGSLIPNDQVCIEMVIDELDINKISVDQEAKVTLDALPGQSFSGIISSLDTSGSNNGGNTKYTARLTMDKTESMLLGMNAAIQIPSIKKSDLLTLPVEALMESKGKTYVYLGYDEKKDELTDPVEVVTGLSDGEIVEIVEGLTEGQTCYYRYADSISYTFK